MVTTLDLIALIARGAIIPLFLAMAGLFRSRYKESGNKFFNGYMIFFIMVALIQIVTFALEVINTLNPGTAIGEFTDARFADYALYESIAKARLLYMNNFIRPSYLAIFIILLIAIGSQVQPLEVFLNYNRHLLSRLNFLSVPFFLSLYLPPLRYTYYAFLVFNLGTVAITFGLLFNLFMNLKLAITGVGEVRWRSFGVVVGLVLYLLGLVWGARTSMSEFISPALHEDSWDVILGSGICAIASLLYYLAFKASKYR